MFSCSLSLSSGGGVCHIDFQSTLLGLSCPARYHGSVEMGFCSLEVFFLWAALGSFSKSQSKVHCPYPDLHLRKKPQCAAPGGSRAHRLPFCKLRGTLQPPTVGSHHHPLSPCLSLHSRATKTLSDNTPGDCCYPDCCLETTPMPVHSDPAAAQVWEDGCAVHGTLRVQGSRAGDCASLSQA